MAKNSGYMPNYINRANAIIDYWEDPCAAPWWVYVKLAREPAGKAILTLVMPSFLDIVRGYFRPRGLRRGGHLRRKRPPFGPQVFPDSSDVIAKNTPGYDAVNRRTVSDGVKFLWIVDGVIQRLFWYWLIIDVVSEFFINWQSAVQESRYCQADNLGAAAISAETQVLIGDARVPIFNYEITHEYGSISAGPTGGGFSTPIGAVQPFLQLPRGGQGRVKSAQAQCTQAHNGRVSCGIAISGWQPLWAYHDHPIRTGVLINGQLHGQSDDVASTAQNPEPDVILANQYLGEP